MRQFHAVEIQGVKLSVDIGLYVSNFDVLRKSQCSHVAKGKTNMKIIIAILLRGFRFSLSTVNCIIAVNSPAVLAMTP